MVNFDIQRAPYNQKQPLTECKLELQNKMVNYWRKRHSVSSCPCSHTANNAKDGTHPRKMHDLLAPPPPGEICVRAQALHMQMTCLQRCRGVNETHPWWTACERNFQSAVFTCHSQTLVFDDTKNALGMITAPCCTMFRAEDNFEVKIAPNLQNPPSAS